MPYMTCNGRTVSRHSTTDEVQLCKATEKKAQQEAYVKCQASPECVKELNDKQESFSDFLLYTAIIFIVFLVCLTVLKNNKED